MNARDSHAAALPDIADYALIGDGRTAALCSSSGSIDWMCAPRFDSDPVFGRLIDCDRGGSFSVSVAGIRGVERSYRHESAVLETAWSTEGGKAVLTEGMILDLSGALLPSLVLVRALRCTEGEVDARFRFDPRRGLPGRPPPRSAVRGGALVCEWGSFALALQCSPRLDVVPGREVATRVRAGDELVFVMSAVERSPQVFVSPHRAIELLDATHRWWAQWSGQCDYQYQLRPAVIRSLVTLRLLTYSPSGAPVAAPTTSLPEVIGGERNWDYRYAWPRDASIGLGAFLGIGRKDEAHSFMHWLLHATRLTRPKLQVLYTIYGKRSPEEQEIDDLSGYRGSTPVRIGNAANTQHQLDVYGWVLDAASLLVRAGHKLHGETWRALCGFADFVAANWQKPDAGIWEIREPQAHHVHSKLMGWLCLDRALRIARSYRVKPQRAARWNRARAALTQDVRTNGFNEELGSYVRSYGSRELDAALLILPVLGFDDDIQRVTGTISAIRADLAVDGAYVYRYPTGQDGLPGSEGAFLPCSFWLVQALARIGRGDEAEELFDELLRSASDLGLMAEEIDPSTRTQLGNFPQAFTHATIVQAALALRESDGLDKDAEQNPKRNVS